MAGAITRVLSDRYGSVQHGTSLGTPPADHGLAPRLMAAEFVQAFRKSRSAKNDHNDAEAIAIGVRQTTASDCQCWQCA